MFGITACTSGPVGTGRGRVRQSIAPSALPHSKLADSSKSGLRSVVGAHAKFAKETTYAPFDVVADETHALDAVYSACGWFVGVPVLEPCSGDRLDVGFASERHHDVDGANEFGVGGLWSLGADVDP
jgi:hypothetical protein